MPQQHSLQPRHSAVKVIDIGAGRGTLSWLAGIDFQTIQSIKDRCMRDIHEE